MMITPGSFLVQCRHTDEITNTVDCMTPALAWQNHTQVQNTQNRLKTTSHRRHRRRETLLYFRSFHWNLFFLVVMDDRLLPYRKSVYFQSVLINLLISARCNFFIYISRLCYDVSVRLSVRLSVSEVHCGHGACREEWTVLHLASARPSCTYLGYLAG